MNAQLCQVASIVYLKILTSDYARNAYPFTFAQYVAANLSRQASRSRCTEMICESGHTEWRNAPKVTA